MKSNFTTLFLILAAVVVLATDRRLDLLALIVPAFDRRRDGCTAARQRTPA